MMVSDYWENELRFSRGTEGDWERLMRDLRELEDIVRGLSEALEAAEGRLDELEGEGEEP